MRLINLLSWLPGYTGFGSYVQRVLPGLEGWRLQLDHRGHGQLVAPEQWLPQSPPWASHWKMRLLQRYSLVQHGLSLGDVLKASNISSRDIEAVYSPFFDALLAWPHIPQLITCHDLTPLLASNSLKAWLRYRFWQPRHCKVATRLIAISRYVADQLITFGVDANSIEVIPNGITIERPRVLVPVSEDLLAIARHDLNKNPASILQEALTHFGRFHKTQAISAKGHEIEVGSKLALYYGNRLQGYGITPMGAA